MDLTYLRKQSDYVSDLSLKDLAKVRGMGLSRPFCGGVFDWSFVRINAEALAALDKLAKPLAPVMKKVDFDFNDAPALADMAVLGADDMRAYVNRIPLHRRSLARIDFGGAARPGAVPVDVSPKNRMESLARVIRHASTADFYDDFMEKALRLPHQSLAEYVFWELEVKKGAVVVADPDRYSWLAAAPRLVFAADKNAAAEKLKNLSASESAALVLGGVDAAEWILACEFAKSFMRENSAPENKIPENIISGWKDAG
ncbi:MAG: hypothetical protein LBG89_02565 [Rickettsiales bacterium]|jgi:hypothetical protein|nr:hypothetical protein [Rickettsiales bacterium]